MEVVGSAAAKNATIMDHGACYVLNIESKAKEEKTQQSIGLEIPICKSYLVFHLKSLSR
jgi:hypothetical protein